MIDYLKLFFSFLVPTIIGASLLSLVFRLPSSKSRSYHIASFLKKLGLPMFLILSFAIGAGLTTYLMFWSGFIGLSLKVFVIILTILAGILSIVFLGWKLCHFLRPNFRSFPKNLLRGPKVGFSSVRWIELILILVILFEAGFIFSVALLRPVFAIDALSTWVWKAKVFFYQPREAFIPASNLFLGGRVHQNYPLHIPLFATWTYLWLGKVDDILVNLIFAFYWLGLIGFVYLSLRSNISRKISLFFTACLTTLPLLTCHGFTAYADLPLTFYFTLAAAFLFNYFSSNARHWKSTYLILAGIFAGLTAWVKNEGLMLAGVLLIVLLIYLIRQKRLLSSQFYKDKHCLKFIIPALLLILPWVIFKNFFGLGYSNVDSGAIIWAGFHPEVYSYVFEQIFLCPTFHLWPGIFILILIISWYKILPSTFTKNAGFDCSNFYLLLIILGVIGGYFVLYLFTSSYQYAVNATSTSRNFLTIMPLSIFLAALLIGERCGSTALNLK